MRSFTLFPSLATVRRPARSATLFLTAIAAVVALLLVNGNVAPLDAHGARALPFLFPRAFQSTASYTVVSVADEGDAAPGDGVCASASGACTLRAAIEEANATVGSTTIAFNIPGPGPHIIELASALPVFAEAVVIDGTSQPGYAGSPVVVLNGSGAGERASGLTLTAGGSSVRGLALYGFQHAAIHLLGNSGYAIEANYVGADASGTAAPGNRIGVLVEDASENRISGNLISGNEVGLYLSRMEPEGTEASGNKVSGNRIGTDAAGLLALPNEVGIRINRAAGNTIGGQSEGERNLISGNGTAIYISGRSASGNRILGNYIGLDAAGHLLPNQQGVYINGVPGNSVGGPGVAGNYIAVTEVGIYLRGQEARSNRVQGNTIGVDVAGTIPAHRAEGGVLIVDAIHNVVGGRQAGEGNRIVVQAYGVRVLGSEAATNQVEGNDLDVEDNEEEDGAGSASLYPVDAARSAPALFSATHLEVRGRPALRPRVSLPAVGLPDLTMGLYRIELLQTGTTFTVNSSGDGADASPGDGVCDGGAGNCTLRAAIQEANATAGSDTIGFNISGSGPHTIQPGSPLPVITESVVIDGSTEPDYAGSPVVELDGSLAGALADGLKIQAASVTIRALVINRFDGAGINITSGATGAVLEGNHIGTDTGGSLALGNLGAGIYLNNAGEAIVGGTSAGTRNVISGNGSAGILVSGTNATGSTIQGNHIGTNAAGSADLGNGLDGIFMRDGATNHTIGGTAAGAGNLVSGNDQDGIELDAAGGIAIQGNKIGTNVDGTAALGNSEQGIRIENGANNTVGGTTTGAGNLVSGNGSQGITITGPNATDNQVLGNHVGTDATGSSAIGNGGAGIYLYGNAGSNTVGGTTAEARNLVSGNTGRGITIADAETTGNTVQGNYVGTDATGSLDLGNSSDGVYIYSSAASNAIGGSAAGAGNVVSGNADSGVYIRNSNGTVVQGNLIGVAADGTTALGNDGRGVYFYSTSLEAIS